MNVESNVNKTVKQKLGQGNLMLTKINLITTKPMNFLITITDTISATHSAGEKLKQFHKDTTPI